MVIEDADADSRWNHSCGKVSIGSLRVLLSSAIVVEGVVDGMSAVAAAAGGRTTDNAVDIGEEDLMQEEAPKHTATALEQPRPGGQRIHPINDAPHSEAASELFPLAACDCDNDGAVIVTICGLYG